MLTFAASSGMELFLPKVYDIVWSIVILIILALFFGKVFVPKFGKVFDKRAKRIQGRMDQAQKAEEEAEKAKRTYEDKLAQANSEASQIRDDARHEASHIVSDARSKAESLTRQMNENAEKAISSQREQAINSLLGELGSVATQLAGKIIGKELKDDQIQSAMIDSLISDMEKQQADQAHQDGKSAQ